MYGTMGNPASRSITRSTLCRNEAIGDASVSPLGMDVLEPARDGLVTFTYDGTSVIGKSHATTSGDNVAP